MAIDFLFPHFFFFYEDSYVTENKLDALNTTLDSIGILLHSTTGDNQAAITNQFGLFGLDCLDMSAICETKQSCHDKKVR